MQSGIAAAALCAAAMISCADRGPSLGSGEAALTDEQCGFFAENGRVQICHRTSSARNPYVIIRTSEAGCVNGHADHAGDYVAVGDPDCNGGGCLPVTAPCDPLVPCCEGLVCEEGYCVEEPTACWEKLPTPICVNGLAVNVMPQGITLFAQDFDAASFWSWPGGDACPHDASLPLAYSFSPDPADASRTFDCSSLGAQVVEMWVTTAWGTQDFCQTVVVVQDNQAYCET